MVSNAGSWLQTVAQDYLVYKITGRALDLGLTNGVRAVALIGLAFMGGTLADRVDKRKLLIITQTLQAAFAALLGVLVQTGTVRVWHIVALSFVGAVILAVDQPARQALIPHLVPRPILMNAIALNSVTFTGAAAIGPALAGPVVALFGMTWSFYLNALSFLAVIGAVRAIQLPEQPQGSQRPTEPVLRSVATGLRYIFSSAPILLVIALLTAYSFLVVPYQALLPVFSAQLFGGDVQVLGWMRAAAGVGALAGGFLLARFAHYRDKDNLLVFGGLGFALAIIGFSRVAWLPAALALLLLGGVLSTIFQSTVQTLMHHLTDDQMRGRVMSLFTICLLGVWPLGTLPMSWASDAVGVTRAVPAEALLFVVIALAVVLGARRGLRQLKV